MDAKTFGNCEILFYKLILNYKQNSCISWFNATLCCKLLLFVVNCLTHETAALRPFMPLLQAVEV
jgi:hypothetical protein